MDATMIRGVTISVPKPSRTEDPAKMAYGLLRRILAHAGQEGWIAPGSVIVDPFGGIGSTGLLGAYKGYQVVLCELEQKFVDLAEQNFKLHDNAWRKLGCPRPVMIQGDSRKLCELVGQAECIVSSPPFLEALASGPSTSGACGPNRAKKYANTGMGKWKHADVDYGSSPGQLGAMKPGSMDTILSSPPYAETLKGDGTQAETAAESRAKRRTEGGSLGQSQRTQGYGNKGNLGNLKPGDVSIVISSPPFQASLTDKPSAGVRKMHGANMGRSALGDGYGNTPGNIANLPPGEIAAIISSPPYEGSLQGKAESQQSICDTPAPTNAVRRYRRKPSGYGYSCSEDNLGNSQGDTFWQAAKIIVEQCYQILRPNGVAIFVVKSFVRRGAIVDFPGDWRRLCESVGFETLHEHHASLVKEDRKPSLFGHEIVKTKSKKSFFRRLAEAHGSPRIDNECVLCMRKP